MNAMPSAYRADISWNPTPKTISEVFRISAPGNVPIFENDRFLQATSEHYRFHKEQLRGVLAFLFSASKGDALLVHGPFGSGKTSLIREILGRLRWPTLMLSWSEKSDSFELIGRQGIQFGDTMFDYGPLALAAKLGMVLVINEIDRGRAGDLVALNDLLDGGNLVIKETGEVIEPHPNFRVICTANSAGSGDLTGQYVGSVRKLDPAFLDRFAMIKVGYMAQEDELDLLMLLFPDYAKKSSLFLTKLTNFAQETRAKALDVAENLATPISTRALMRTLNLGRSMGLLRRIGEADFSTSEDLLPALDLAYLNRLPAEEREAAVKTLELCMG